MARTGRLLADIRPLRESAAFRRLWAGSTLSAVGGSMTVEMRGSHGGEIPRRRYSGSP